ncbi:ATP-binding protein [Pseudomonas koreensis]|uniref:ATP-binding protein n=1 Tax=Pseudomonas koreensis TaxID=198620 RepID=UPI001473D930|nr:ATP-binding protein [Pseudomonas koreensis]NNA56109.1 response regulator [Pseudomonas koreensis]
MRLKSYLHQINPFLSSPEAARRLLRLFALVLMAGILSASYNFLRSTLANDISQRRSYMSSAVAEAQTFFTSRESLLESLGLSAVCKPMMATPLSYSPSIEDHSVQLGISGGAQWTLWLTRRMLDYMQRNQLNLIYVSAEANPQVNRLYTASTNLPRLPRSILDQLSALNDQLPERDQELWLTDQAATASQLYIFIRLDDGVKNSGWLGLEMDGAEISAALNDQSAGTFMMLNSHGSLLFANTPAHRLGEALSRSHENNYFGFVGSGWLPDHLVIRKQLKSTDWQLVYSFDLLDLLKALMPQLLAALAFCLASMILIWLLIRRVEHRFITPALNRLQALIESEAFSRDVIQTAPVALCVLRRTDGQVMLENTLSERWLGNGIEREMLCKSWIEQAFDTTQPNRSDYFSTVDGRHLYLSSAPTRYKSEDVLFCAFSDISARKQVEAALEEARRLADAANEAKTLFLATMSHEIRTPLYGVLGTLELLGRTRLDSQQKGYLRAIEGSSATLLQLICDVLDVSKIEAGQLALELHEFAPTELVYEAIQGYAAAAQSKGVQLYACMDPQMPERLIGDVTRIRQILNNLLSNAVKFTDSGRVVLRVRLLDCADEKAQVAWQVTDTGRGISRDDQAHIFEPFYQTEGNTNVVAGTGLGLPICKRLTQLMNGTLRMVSEKGLGSSFTLTLPLDIVTRSLPATHCLLPNTIYVASAVRELNESIAGWLRRWGARAQVAPLGNTTAARGSLLIELHAGDVEQRLMPNWCGPLIIATANLRNTPASQPECRYVNVSHLYAIHQAVSQAQGLWVDQTTQSLTTSALKKLNLHLLVAEDNDINQLILRDQLEELGCSVELACNGEEALALWKTGTFDVVLSDVNMPKLNGYELAKELRRLGYVQPIIGATANAMRGEEALCLEAGMDHCLVKPFALRALFNCLLPYGRAAPQNATVQPSSNQ